MFKYERSLTGRGQPGGWKVGSNQWTNQPTWLESQWASLRLIEAHWGSLKLIEPHWVSLSIFEYLWVSIYIYIYKHSKIPNHTFMLNTNTYVYEHVGTCNYKHIYIDMHCCLCRTCSPRVGSWDQQRLISHHDRPAKMSTIMSHGQNTMMMHHWWPIITHHVLQTCFGSLDKNY